MLSTLPLKAACLLCCTLLCLAVSGQTFRNPIWNSGPDPTMAYHNGYYYLTYTNGSQLDMIKAASINDIPSATPIRVWSDPTPSRCCHMWAPALRLLNKPDGAPGEKRWYLYYCADDGNDANHRNYVLESSGTDPLGPYTFKGKLIPTNGDEKGIDGNVLVRDDGALFFIWCWSGRVAIATMSNPWTVTSSRVVISSPVYDWEKQQAAINENPGVLKRNGKTFLTYSASHCVSPGYTVGMLTNTNGDYMNPAAWSKSPVPVFYRSPDDGVYGPGGNDFFRSPDGTEDWIVYHATSNPNGDCGPGRSTRIQKISWNSDDTPIFGLPTSQTTDVFLPAGDPNADPANSSSIVSGETYKLRHKGTSMFLDVDNNSSAPGANVWQWSANTSNAQRWVVTLQSDGHYTLNHKGTDQNLAAANNSTVAGEDVVQWTSDSVHSQRWKIELQPSGYHKLTHKGTNICLDVLNNSAAEGANVIQWTDNGNDAQRWKMEMVGEVVPGATYRLQHKGTNQYLDVDNNSSTPGANVWQWTGSSSTAQQWVITLEAGGFYKLTHKGTNQCLDVLNNLSTPGTNVMQWTDNGADAQRWKFDHMGDGYFKLTHKGTNQCLDVANNRSSSGADVIQWTDNGNDAQRWRLELVELPAQPLSAQQKKAPPVKDSAYLNIYPNPTHTNANIRYIADVTGKVDVILYNMEGKPVKGLFTGNVIKGQPYTIPVNGDKLLKGVYVIKVWNRQRNIQAIKFILQ